MATRPVHWEEGMFLGPQHLQAAQRFEARQRHLFARSAMRFNWGLSALDLNAEALRNHRFEALSLRAFLRDGTMIDLPNDGSVPVSDFRPALEQSSPLMVWLAVPSMQPGRANATDRPADRRFVLETLATEDENAQSDPQPIRYRLVNSRFFATNETEQGGFDVLPIARLKRGSDANNTPVIDADYIPPVLSCEVWPVLQIDILRGVFDRIGAKITVLADQMVSRGISLESNQPEEARIVAQLRILNEVSSVMGLVAFTDGIHPLDAYRELCHIVGQLSIYGRPRRLEPLPPYDHENLGPIFWEVKRRIDMLLDEVMEPDWQAQPFRGVALRMQVDLKPAWLEPGWQMFVGVKTNLSSDECSLLITNPNALDMKIGSHDRVDELFAQGRQGVEFRYQPQLPPALPRLQGLTYFQMNRMTKPEEWAAVDRTKTLALRLNPRLVQGTIAGTEELTILHPRTRQPMPLSLTLYVLRPR